MGFHYKSLVRIAVVVGVLLLIPLILTIRDGGVEGVGWNWTLGDFVAMGSLLFIAGLAIDFALRRFTTPAYRAVAIIIIVFVFLAVWAELAVDAVSKLIAAIAG